MRLVRDSACVYAERNANKHAAENFQYKLNRFMQIKIQFSLRDFLSNCSTSSERTLCRK